MYDYQGNYSSRTPSGMYGDVLVGAEQRPAVVGKVLGLLGFAAAFTAGGAALGVGLGPGAFFISIIGSLITLFALFALKERAPINLALLYGFATFEGMALGLILQSYVARGLGGAIVNAAATTAAVTVVAGLYGSRTKRDLSSLRGMLMIGLFAVIIASIVGLFLQMPMLYLAISAVTAVLFTGFLVVDLNRVANARGATEGQAILLAVSVYLDILNLFLALLRIFGYLRDND